MDIAQLTRLDDLVRPLKVWHATLLRADLHNALVLILRGDDRGAFAQFVRQRLLDIHVLSRRTRIHGERHVQMVGRSDDHRIDVASREQVVVILRSRRIRIRQFFAGFHILIPNVADSRNAHARDLFERVHQLLAATSGADATDVQRFIGRKTSRRGPVACEHQTRGQADLFDEFAAAGIAHRRSLVEYWR